MKMMQGACFLPCSNRSRTRLAPTPTNISTKSDPEMEKKGTPASPAMARASSVFPVPGDPMRRTPLGNGPAGLGDLLRALEEGEDPLAPLFRPFMAGTFGDGDLVSVSGGKLRL